MEYTPMSIRDFEAIFLKTLNRKTLLYIQSGAHNETTLQDNVDAYTRYKLQPRVLRDVSNLDTRTTVLGQSISMPICIAPSGIQRVVHPDGEVATAKAATETCYVMSTAATSTIEEVQEAAPVSLKWFQLYIFRQKDVSLNLVRRAERCGFKALVLTVDSAVFPTVFRPPPFQLPKHLR